MDMEKMMTIDGRPKSSSGRHNKVKKDVSTIGRKRMSEEEFDKEMEEHLDVFMKLLQRKKEENQRRGWNVI